MSKAFKNSMSFADAKVRAVVFTLMTAGIGFLLIRYFTGHDESATKVQEWVLSGLAAAAIAFGVVYVICFALAPYHIHVEEAAAHAKTVQVMTAAHATAQREILAGIDTLKAERDAAIGERDAVRAKADAVLATPADVAEELRMLSRRGRAMLQQDHCWSDESFQQWLSQARKLVALTLRPSYAEEFERAMRGAIRTGDPIVRSQSIVDQTTQWLNGWEGKLSAAHVSPDCTLQKLRAATQP
jgi:hypothetical protein